MKESTLMRNHSAACSVRRNSPHQVLWRNMNESTLMRNHSAAQSVKRSSATQVIWKLMKESTLMTNHSGAQSVTRHSEPQVISRNMTEHIQRTKCEEPWWSLEIIIHAEAWGIIHSLYIYLNYKCFGKLVFRTFLRT